LVSLQPAHTWRQIHAFRKDACEHEGENKDEFQEERNVFLYMSWRAHLVTGNDPLHILMRSSFSLPFSQFGLKGLDSQ
jgi:hypothetical protein